MKKNLFLIIFIIFALTLSSCQSSTKTDKKTTSEDLPANSVSTQATTVDKDENTVSTQTTTVDKDENSSQIKAVNKDGLANTTDKDVNFEKIYNDFLSGQIYAIDKEGQKLSMNYYQKSDPPKKYAIYDMNGDAIPELIIRTRISLYIYWIYNNELILWQSNAQYAKPLNNMALLYERPGGAPDHTDYMYIVLGYQGEELYCIEFSKYANETQDPEYDYKYFINNTEVTKDAFNSLSELLLSIGDDKIEWKSFLF